jgi:hypothetical protein
LLNDESWKDTQVSNKQAKASPTPSTKKKEKKIIEELVNGIVKGIVILIWTGKEISGKESWVDVQSTV